VGKIVSTRYVWFKLVSFLSMTLPRPILYWVAHRLADFNHRFDHRGRHAVRDNLRVILGPQAPEDRIRYEARWVFRNFGKYLAEFFGYQRFGARFIDTYIDFIGLEHVDAALARGKGAVINTAHLSNWEIGAAAFARKGYPLTAIAQMHPEPDVNELFRRQRASRSYFVIPPEGALRRCTRALRENQLVCFVGDRTAGEGDVEVTFMGRPCRFPQGPARIALAAGAPLIPGFVIRRTSDSFAIVVEPPIEPPHVGDRREAARIMTQKFADVVAQYVRMFPAQWGVFFKAWPDGEEISTEDAAAAQRPAWGRGTGGAGPPTEALPIREPTEPKA
jgi:lauroyl/myristoyl acyltransferase